MVRKKKIALSTTQIILLSFLVTILFGSVLLALPVSSASGEAVPYLDALFTATTSTCVTGLVTLPTVSTWSVFGQAVILILIQIGGLGIITIMSGLMILLNKKMGIGDRLLIQDAFNLNTMSGLGKFVKNVLLGTLLIEGIGALLYMCVFVPELGAQGIWVFRHLTLHSKIAITVTAGLILVGAILIFIFEYNNPLTIGKMSLFDKIQTSVFQSVTTRTAGFASVPQENLTNASAAVSIVLMLIGGSPVGTAGGMKTVTIAVLVCSTFATIRNKKSGVLFGRRISEESVKKAVAVAVSFLTICVASTVLLMSVSDASAIDVVYETVSATATVGLSRNFTASLGTFGKLIIIITMYFGRVGPISLAVALGSNNESQNVISEPTEDISIG